MERAVVGVVSLYLIGLLLWYPISAGVGFTNEEFREGRWPRLGAVVAMSTMFFYWLAAAPGFCV